MNGRLVDALIQVEAKFFMSDLFGQVVMRGAHQPRIEGEFFFAAQTSKLLLLNHAQQPDLRRGRKVSYLVEEERSVSGLFEKAYVLFVGACECALFVAEHLAFEQMLVDGGDLRRHKGRVGARP